jgi:hypothetical protein
MKHLLAMAFLAALVSLAFAVISPADTVKARALVGLRSFGEFLGVGLLLAWIFYFLPW